MKNRILSVLAIIVAFSFVGCIEEAPAQPSSAQIEMRQNEQSQQKLIKSVPIPKVNTSLERKNLVRRIEKINQENMISYIYLISYGKIMAYYTVSGKVSSLNSYLTAMEKIEKVDGGHGINYGPTFVTLEAPDLDGSYGKNVEGVFFFTTEGAYVEWRGEYLWSDQPLKITQQPELIKEIK